MKPGGLCSPSDGSSSPSGDEISSVSVACKTLGGSSQFPDASTSEDSPACLTPDLIEDRHQGAKPNSSIANGYICNDVTNGLCGTLYDTSKDIDVPRHVLSPPCSEDGEDGASRSRTISAGGVASKGSDPSTLYQGRCKTPEFLEGRSPAAPSNKAKSLPPQLSGKSIEESPAGTSEHSNFSVYNESVERVSAGSNSNKVPSCSEPQSAPHNVKSPKYRRKCSLEEMVAKLHNRSEPNIQAGSGALQAFSPTRTNPDPKEDKVASCFTKTEGDDEPSSMSHSEHRQSIPCDNPNTATCDAHLLRDSSTKDVLPRCNSEEPTKACDELCVYNKNSSGELCERTSGSVGSCAEKEDPDPSQSMLSEGDIACESNAPKKHLDVSSSRDGGGSPKAVVNSDLTDTRTSLNDRTSASFCVSNENVFNISKDAQSDVLVDVSRTTSEKDTIEKDAKFELKQQSCSSKSESSSINIMPKNTSVEAIERKDSDEIEVLTSHETSLENEVINLVDDDTGDSGSDVEILYERGRHVGIETLALACPEELRKGDTEKMESARKSSLSGSGYGNGQYLEPISDEENSLICAPSPPSELSSASGFPSSSDTPLFSDTPSDASRGAIMVKISDAVAAILSDVSDDSLPPSPEECSTQNSFSNLLPKLLLMNDKCSGSPVTSNFSGASVTDSVVGERSSSNEEDDKNSNDSETAKDEVSCEKATSGDLCVAQSDDKKCESGDLMQMSLTVDSSCKERLIASPKKVDIDLPSSLTDEIDSNLTEHNQTKSVDTSLDLSASQEQKANVGLPSSSISEALESADTNSRVSFAGSGHSGPSQLVKSLVDRLPCRSCSMHSTPLLSNDPCNTNSLCQKPTSGTPCLSSQPNNCNRLRSGCRECVPDLSGENVSQDSLTGCMSVDNLQLEIQHKEEPTTLREFDEPFVEAVSDSANDSKKTETSEISLGNILTLSVPDGCEGSGTSQTDTLTQPLSTPKDEIKTASVLESENVRAEAGTSAMSCDVAGKIIVPSTSSEDSEDSKGSPQPTQEPALVPSAAPEAILACKNLSSDLWDNNGKLGVHSKRTEEPQTTTVSVECTEGFMNPASTSLAVHKDVDLSSNVAFYEGRTNFLSSSVDDDSSVLGKLTSVEDELPLETQDSSNVHSLPEIIDDSCIPTQEISSNSKLENNCHLLSSDLSTGHISDIESLSQLTILDHKNQTSIGIVSCNDSVSTVSQSLNSEVESTVQIACSEGNIEFAAKSRSSLESVCSHNENVSCDKDCEVPPCITETAIPSTSSHSGIREEEKCISSNTGFETHSIEALPLIPEDLEKDSLHKSSVPGNSHSGNNIEDDLVLPLTLKPSFSRESQLCQPLNEDPSDEATSLNENLEHQGPVMTATPKDSSTRVFTDNSELSDVAKTESANVTHLLVNLEDKLPSGNQILTSRPEEEKSESLLTVESRLNENYSEKVSKESDEGGKVIEEDSMKMVVDSVGYEEKVVDNSTKEAVHSFAVEAPISVACISPKNSEEEESVSGIQVRKVLSDFTPSVTLEEEKAEYLENCLFNSKTSPKASIGSPRNDGMHCGQQLSDSVPEASFETESKKIFSDCAKTDTSPGVLERLADPLEKRLPIRTSDLQVTDSVMLAVPPKANETKVLEDSVITDSGLVPDIVDVKGLGGVKTPEEVVADRIVALVDSTDAPAIGCPDTAAEVNIACELQEILRETELAEKVHETESDFTVATVQAGSCLAEVLCPVIPETENDFMIETRLKLEPGRETRLKLEPGHPTTSLTETVAEREDVTKTGLGIEVSEKPNLTFSEPDSDIFSDKIALDPNATKLPMKVKVSESSITTLPCRVSDPILSERVEESVPTTITDRTATPLPETICELDEMEILDTAFVGEHPSETVVSEDTLKNETGEGELDAVNREIYDIKRSTKPSEESSKNEEQQETGVTQPSAVTTVTDVLCESSLDESSHEHMKTETSCDTSSSSLELDNTKISSETSDQFLPVRTSNDFGIADKDCVGKDVQSENSVTESSVETVLTEVHCETLEEAVRNEVLDETAFETTSASSEEKRDNVDTTEFNCFIAKQPRDDVTKTSGVSLHAETSVYSSLDRTSAESDIVKKLDEYVSMEVSLEAVLPGNIKETDSTQVPTNSVKAGPSVEPVTVEEQFEKGAEVTGELVESGITAEKEINKNRDALLEGTLGENDVTKVSLGSSPTETSIVASADKSVDSNQSKSLFETKLAEGVDPLLMESTSSKACDFNVAEPADVELDTVCGKSLDKISPEPKAVISDTADSLPLHDNSNTLVDFPVNEASVEMETEDCKLTLLSSLSESLLKAPGISATEAPIDQEIELDAKLYDVINKTPESSKTETPCEMHEAPKLTVDPHVPVNAAESEESQKSTLTVKTFETDKIRKSAKSEEVLETEHIQESTFDNIFKADEKQELVTPETTIDSDHFLESVSTEKPLEFNEILESTAKIQESFVTAVQVTSEDSESSNTMASSTENFEGGVTTESLATKIPPESDDLREMRRMRGSPESVESPNYLASESPVEYNVQRILPTAEEHLQTDETRDMPMNEGKTTTTDTKTTESDLPKEPSEINAKLELEVTENPCGTEDASSLIGKPSEKSKTEDSTVSEGLETGETQDSSVRNMTETESSTEATIKEIVSETEEAVVSLMQEKPAETGEVVPESLMIDEPLKSAETTQNLDEVDNTTESALTECEIEEGMHSVCAEIEEKGQPVKDEKLCETEETVELVNKEDLHEPDNTHNLLSKGRGLLDSDLTTESSVTKDPQEISDTTVIGEEIIKVNEDIKFDAYTDKKAESGLTMTFPSVEATEVSVLDKLHSDGMNAQTIIPDKLPGTVMTEVPSGNVKLDSELHCDSVDIASDQVLQGIDIERGMSQDRENTEQRESPAQESKGNENSETDFLNLLQDPIPSPREDVSWSKKSLSKEDVHLETNEEMKNSVLEETNPVDSSLSVESQYLNKDDEEKSSSSYVKISSNYSDETIEIAKTSALSESKSSLATTSDVVEEGESTSSFNTAECLPPNDFSIDNTPQKSVPDALVKVISDPEVICSQACTLIDFDSHLSGYVNAEKSQLLPPKSTDKPGSSLEMADAVLLSEKDGSFSEKSGDHSHNITERIEDAGEHSTFDSGELRSGTSSEITQELRAVDAEGVPEKSDSIHQDNHEHLNKESHGDERHRVIGMEMIPYKSPSRFLENIVKNYSFHESEISFLGVSDDTENETLTSRIDCDKLNSSALSEEEIVSYHSIPDEMQVDSKNCSMEKLVEFAKCSVDMGNNVECLSEVKVDAETYHTDEPLSLRQDSTPCSEDILKEPAVSKDSDGVNSTLMDSKKENLLQKDQSESLVTTEEFVDGCPEDASAPSSHTEDGLAPQLPYAVEYQTELSITKETVEHLSLDMKGPDVKSVTQTPLDSENSEPSHDHTQTSVDQSCTSPGQETKYFATQLNLNKAESFEGKGSTQSLEEKSLGSPPQVPGVAESEDESLVVANKENHPVEVCSPVKKSVENESYRQFGISSAASAKETLSDTEGKNFENLLDCGESNYEAAIVGKDVSTQIVEPEGEESMSRVGKEQFVSEDINTKINNPSVIEASHALSEPDETHFDSAPCSPNENVLELDHTATENVDLSEVVGKSSTSPSKAHSNNSDSPTQDVGGESTSCMVSDGALSFLPTSHETPRVVPQPSSRLTDVESTLSEECASPKQAVGVEDSGKNAHSVDSVTDLKSSSAECVEESCESDVKPFPELPVTSEDRQTFPEEANIPEVSVEVSCVQKTVAPLSAGDCCSKDNKDASSKAKDSDSGPITEPLKSISDEMVCSQALTPDERKIKDEPAVQRACQRSCSSASNSEKIDQQEITVCFEGPAEISAREVDGTEKKGESEETSVTTDNPPDVNLPQEVSLTPEKERAAAANVSHDDEEESSLLDVVEVKREVCFSGEDSQNVEDSRVESVSCTYDVKDGVITILDDKIEDDATEPPVLELLCPLCREVLAEPLEEHIIKHHICVSFIPAKSTPNYRHHMVLRVSETLDLPPELVSGECAYVCRSCHFSSKDINAVRFHLNIHEDIYQVRTGVSSCSCNQKVYSYQFHRWKSLIHSSIYYCGACSYYFACEQGLMNHVVALHYVQNRCKICNEEISDNDVVIHLDLHNPDCKGEEGEVDLHELQMTTRSKGCYGVSWNIYDNFLNYLDGKYFRLNVANKVADKNHDRSYLTLPIRNVLDEVTVPDRDKLDPAKDMRKYLQGKKDIRASEGEINEVLKNFSWFVQMHLEKKSGMKKGKSSSSHSRAKKENDLFDILGIRTVKLKSSSKKEGGSPDSTKSAKRKSIENKQESPPEEGISDPTSLTRTRSGMQPTKEESDSLMGDFMNSLALERNSEINGEWSREHTYVCCACGTGYLDLADMMDHKWECHPSVWCAHTMFQGQDSVPQSFCSQFQPPTGRPKKSPVTTPLSPIMQAGPSQIIIQGTPDPKTEISADDSKEKNLMKCSRCGVGFAEVELFHSHLVECGGLHQIMVIKKKNKKGFRFKRRKGQGIPSNRYGASSLPSTPLKAKLGDRSSGLNTPLLDKSHSSLIQSSGVKRRLELAIGSINNHELKNRLKAIISGTKGSSSHALGVPGRRTIKMKLRKKAFDSRLLRKTRHSDKVKEDASKVQKGDEASKVPKNDEKLGSAVKDEKGDVDGQPAKKTVQKKGISEAGKDRKLQGGGDKSSHPEGNKNKVKKSGSSSKLAGGKKSGLVSDNVVGSENVSVTTSVAAEVPGDLNVAKKKPKGGKKLLAEKKINGLINVSKQKVTSDTKQLDSSASDIKTVDVKKVLAKKILAKKNKTISNEISDTVSDKVINIVESDSLIGNKEISVQKRLKHRLSKTAPLKMKEGDKAVPPKSEKAKSKKAKGLEGLSTKKESVKPKSTAGKTLKSLDLIMDEKVPKALKKAKQMVPVIGVKKLDPQTSLPAEVVPSQLIPKKKVKETQVKDRPSGASSGKTKFPAKAATSTVVSPAKKSRYISSSSSEEVDDDSEDSEPEVIRNFRSGRGCTGRLGLRNKSRPMLSRYSFRTCLEPAKRETQEELKIKEDVEDPVEKPEPSDMDKALSSDKDELSDSLPVSKKRKRKIANYENQDDCAYVPYENSSDSEDDDDDQVDFSGSTRRHMVMRRRKKPQPAPVMTELEDAKEDVAATDVKQEGDNPEFVDESTVPVGAETKPPKKKNQGKDPKRPTFPVKTAKKKYQTKKLKFTRKKSHMVHPPKASDSVEKVPETDSVEASETVVEEIPSQQPKKPYSKRLKDKASRSNQDENITGQEITEELGERLVTKKKGKSTFNSNASVLGEEGDSRTSGKSKSSRNASIDQSVKLIQVNVKKAPKKKSSAATAKGEIALQPANQVCAKTENVIGKTKTGGGPQKIKERSSSISLGNLSRAEIVDKKGSKTIKKCSSLSNIPQNISKDSVSLVDQFKKRTLPVRSRTLSELSTRSEDGGIPAPAETAGVQEQNEREAKAKKTPVQKRKALKKRNKVPLSDCLEIESASSQGLADLDTSGDLPLLSLPQVSVAIEKDLTLVKNLKGKAKKVKKVTKEPLQLNPISNLKQVNATDTAENIVSHSIRRSRLSRLNSMTPGRDQSLKATEQQVISSERLVQPADVIAEKVQLRKHILSKKSKCTKKRKVIETAANHNESDSALWSQESSSVQSESFSSSDELSGVTKNSKKRKIAVKTVVGTASENSAGDKEIPSGVFLPTKRSKKRTLEDPTGVGVFIPTKKSKIASGSLAGKKKSKFTKGLGNILKEKTSKYKKVVNNHVKKPVKGKLQAGGCKKDNPEHRVKTTGSAKDEMENDQGFDTMPVLEPMNIASHSGAETGSNDNSGDDSAGGGVSVRVKRRRSSVEKIKDIPTRSTASSQENPSPPLLQAFTDEQGSLNQGLPLFGKETSDPDASLRTSKNPALRKRRTQSSHEIGTKELSATSQSVNTSNSAEKVNKKKGDLPNNAVPKKPSKRKRAASVTGVPKTGPGNVQKTKPEEIPVAKGTDSGLVIAKVKKTSQKKKKTSISKKDLDDPKCLDCGLRFDSVASLEDHRQDCITIALEMSLMEAEDHLFECQHCHLTFALKGTHRQHTASCRLGKYKRPLQKHDSKGRRRTSGRGTNSQGASVPPPFSEGALLSSNENLSKNHEDLVKDKVDNELPCASADNYISQDEPESVENVNDFSDSKEPDCIRSIAGSSKLDHVQEFSPAKFKGSPKYRRRSRTNGKVDHIDTEEPLSTSIASEDKCVVCGCEIRDEDMSNKHLLLEQFAHSCQQQPVLEVCVLLAYYNLSIEAVRSLAASAIFYQGSTILKLDAKQQTSPDLDPCLSSTENKSASQLLQILATPHCMWVSSVLEAIAKHYYSVEAVSISGTRQEALKAITVLEELFKEIANIDSTIRKNQMLRTMKETFEAGTL
ncbi:microtubule-associated protein futsch-like [Macrobrachium rosenbergii]|uniref:microtubule-associated protein futsch-like n=1 Tax=Macrobrachium rosenbergii TaxID=79674 RepID=UPI0034D6C585